jgi:hypothetical protein
VVVVCPGRKSEMSLETVKDKVLGMVNQLDEIQLMQVVTSLTLTVKESKKNRKQALQNTILRHLSSEELEDSADEGLAVFQKLDGDLTEMLAENQNGVDDKTQIEQLKKTVDELLRRGPNGDSSSSSSDSQGGHGERRLRNS